MEKTFQFAPTDGEAYYVKVTKGEVTFNMGTDSAPAFTSLARLFSMPDFPLSSASG